MRELTFQGFLKNYIKELSISNSLDFNKLVLEIQKNPRIKEPLYLYSIVSNKQTKLKQLLENNIDYNNFMQMLINHNLYDLLDSNRSKLKIEYIKVWKSYLSKRNRPQSINHTKELILNKVNEYKKLKNISNYRIYTDLKLNNGNINAWLKNGECDKVSLETARKVLKYLEELK